MRQRFLSGALCASLITMTTLATADSVDDYIRAQMQKRHIVGLSLAIIQDGKIVKAQGYGYVDAQHSAPVTPDTLFQAGSISKSVAAAGALHLVEQGKLSLDQDINTYLTSWHLPENSFTAEQKVTVRRILSHTAGLTVHGFPGYAVDAPRPTLTQILDGASPTNTPAIRVDTTPGTIWRYSGGGYTILQQAILDVTGDTFPDFMQRFVLEPFGMKSSTYQQPLPPEKQLLTAQGYNNDGSPVEGRWHIYPEMAAAGLWTTASDLCRFAIGIQRSAAGTANPVISQSMTRNMLVDQKDNDGLGVFLESKGKSLRFGHNGRDEGFDANLIAYAGTGQGAAIMINANEDSGMVGRILEVIAEHYHWPDYPKLARVTPVRIPMEHEVLTSLQGCYDRDNGDLLSIAAEKDGLSLSRGGAFIDTFVPVSQNEFVGEDSGVHWILEHDSAGKTYGFTSVWGNSRVQAIRIGPRPADMHATPDPDPARTKRIETLLIAFSHPRDTGQSLEGVAEGAQHDFGTQPIGDVAGIRDIHYLGEADVSAHTFHRHNGTVTKVLYFGMNTDKGGKYILVYLTADGLLTDFDALPL